MLFLKIIALFCFIASIALSIFLVRLLGLRKKGINFADLAFPLLVFAYYYVTDKASFHSGWPVLGLSFSILGLGIVFYFHSPRSAPYGSSRDSRSG